MPVRVGGLSNIGRRGIGLRVSVGVNHANQFNSAIFGVTISLKMNLRIDCVHPARRGSIGTGVPRIDHTRAIAGPEVSAKQSAGLVR